MLKELARRAALSPGHVTGFFEIHDRIPEPEKRGSRGAGFSVAAGATTLVEVEPADRQEIAVHVNREPSEANVTRAAIRELLQVAVREGKLALDRDAPRGERAKARVRAWTDLALPVSQGFGMSAAGALSTSLALAKALGLGRSDALRAAHLADVQEKGGLGDVVAAAHGGFEVRTAPGLPPFGSLMRFVGEGEVVLAVVGDALPTKRVLSDPKRRQAINAIGGRLVDELRQAPSLERFFELSNRFADEAGLLTPEVASAIDAARPHGRVAMSMLGASVFAMGHTELLQEVLSDHGEVFVTRVSHEPARLLEIEEAR